VSFQFSLPEGAAVDLRMYDALGRKVFSSYGLRASSFGLRTSSFSPGLYLLRLESGEYHATRKLILE